MTPNMYQHLAESAEINWLLYRSANVERERSSKFDRVVANFPVRFADHHNLGSGLDIGEIAKYLETHVITEPKVKRDAVELLLA